MPPIINIPETASTNSFLKEFLSTHELEEGTIITTSHQTSGRGQKGNSWESEQGQNLTFSLLLKPTFVPIIEQFILSQLVSLSIYEVLSRYTSDITIKWPNDIYWQDKKICGILIENILSDDQIAKCIIGVGLNVNQDIFHSSAPNPISLKQITGQTFDLETMLTLIQLTILKYYNTLINGGDEMIIAAYKDNLYRKNGFYSYIADQQEFKAKIKDILLTGHLVLETLEGEIKTFAFKEVKYVLATLE